MKPYLGVIAYVSVGRFGFNMAPPLVPAAANAAVLKSKNQSLVNGTNQLARTDLTGSTQPNKHTHAHTVMWHVCKAGMGFAGFGRGHIPQGQVTMWGYGYRFGNQTKTVS